MTDDKDQALKEQIARAFDVPTWVAGVGPRPRFARLRWTLRRVPWIGKR